VGYPRGIPDNPERMDPQIVRVIEENERKTKWM